MSSEDLSCKLNYYYLTVVAESIFIVVLSGVVVVVLIVSVVAGAILCVVVSTAVESVLLFDIEDSFVPQLTAITPSAAININFFIILI
jgi:hypothetical protein